MPRSLFIKRFFILLLGFCFFATGAVCAHEVAESFFRIKTNKAYDLVLDDVEFAVTEQNFRIVSRLDIGRAIRREENTTSPRIETLLFCSIGHLQLMMTDDEHLVDYCPMKIVVRQLGANESTLVVVALLPETSPHAKEVNELLRLMAQYAVSK